MQLREGGLISPSDLTRIGYFRYRTYEILSSRATFTISRSILLPYATVVRRHLNLGQMLGQMFITLTATAVGAGRALYVIEGCVDPVNLVHSSGVHTYAQGYYSPCIHRPEPKPLH